MKNFKPILFMFFFWATGLAAQQYYPLCGTGGNDEPESFNQAQTCNTSFTTFLANHTDDMVPQGTDRKLRIRTNVIFVQNEEGDGNFSTSNPAHMDFWNKVFIDANKRLESLIEESCQCTTQPVHYTDIRLEFVPTFIEVRDNFAWDHNNDPDPNAGTQSVNSFNKPYLNYINTLAQQSPGYQDGFNVIITTDGPDYNTYVYNNPDNKPLWELNYTSFYSGYWYSAFPTFDLDHPAMWHAPDAYLWYINGYDHLGGDWWLETEQIPYYAGTFLHEYGHYLNLSHTSTTCTSNIMKPGASSDESLSGCQVRSIYLTLMTKNIRKYVICEEDLNFDLTVDTDETWRLNMRVFGDIRVKSGATLTITCQVHMSPKGQIIVERGGTLIVDGGLITGDCSDRWSAIRVEGDVPGMQANSGRVILRNDAIIENARDAISMNPAHLPWNNGGQQNFYGGIVQAENSTIRNCVRGVEFMRYGYGGVKDQSWFDKVTFENLGEGVTMWADDGVTFDNCTFRQIGKRGIHPYDCEVIVRESNVFEKTPIGVDVITTYPVIFSSQIGKQGIPGNQFTCQTTGVNIQSGGNVAPLKIVNNTFSGSNKGVRQNGNGLLYVENNSFSGHLTAIEIYNAGISFNHVRENNIAASFLGSHAVKTNTGLRYLDNCFSSNQLVDIFVSAGNIFPNQGDDDLAANNCFTKNGIPEIDNDGGTLPLFYFIKTGTPQSSCKFPVNLNNVTLDFATDENMSACGPNFVPGDDEEEFCEIDESLSLSILKQKHAEMLAQVNALPWNAEWSLVSAYQHCLEGLEALIARKMLDPVFVDSEGGKENAITYFTRPVMNFKNRTTAYGIMMYYGEMSRARTFLNGLTAQNPEESDFIAVQNINLDYLAQPQTYQLSESTRNYLHTVGSSDEVYGGYARSLYEVLTGERIEVDIPEVHGRSKSQASAQFAKAGMLLYPNPVRNGVFHVSIENLPAEATCRLLLTDATGALKRTFLINGNGVHSFEEHGLPSGIYGVTVMDNLGTRLYQAKLVVIH